MRCPLPRRPLRRREGWSQARRLLKVLQFGMIHAVIGVPIGVALALSLGGAHFMRVYLREYRRHLNQHDATLESTAAHTVYNGLIVLLVVVAVGLDAIV